MRLCYLSALAVASLGFTAAGCKRAGGSAVTAPGGGGVGATALPAGWKVYTPPEGDFSVDAPADPSVVNRPDADTQKVRFYRFNKGEAGLIVTMFSERTGKARQMDSPDEVRADPHLVAGTLRDIPPQGGMKGLEFRLRDPQQGETAHRAYRSDDGSRAVGLTVLKPQSLSDAEVRAFLESFKLLR